MSPRQIRRTKQRQLVLEAVQASDDHPSAAQIYQRVRRRYPGIAYATIYNALRWWVERGELREFTFGDAATRYDRNRERHDHAICTRCGRLLDVTVRLPRKILEDVRRRTGLEVVSHHVQFLGLCPDCAARTPFGPPLASVARPTQLLEQLQSALTSADSRLTKAQRVAELIRHARAYRWVGLYDVGSDEIAILAWSGPHAPTHPRFPASQGLCGAAVRSRTTVVVGDVTADPRYLTTFASTRSEIAVPILHATTGVPLGVLDVESERRNAFGVEDRSFLEECAAALASLWE